MISSYVLDFTKGAVQGVMIIFSFFHPAGKAGGSQIRRCQGIAVKSYGFTLGVLALTPSGFCNVRVNCPVATNRVLKNVMSPGQTRQNPVKKCSL
jgi:hypothetical protein